MDPITEKMMVESIVENNKNFTKLFVMIENITGTCKAREADVQNSRKAIEKIETMASKIKNHDGRIATMETNQKPWNNLKIFGVVFMAILTISGTLIGSFFTFKNFKNDVLTNLKINLTAIENVENKK